MRRLPAKPTASNWNTLRLQLTAIPEKAGEEAMCGIAGIVGTDEVAPLLVESVTRLECQDYDSCGLAIYNGTGIEVRKDVGHSRTLPNDGI